MSLLGQVYGFLYFSIERNYVMMVGSLGRSEWVKGRATKITKRYL